MHARDLSDGIGRAVSRFVGGRTPARLPFYQYWHAPDVPADVGALICRFAAENPGFAHRLHDHKSGRDFIRRRFGARELAAFDACEIPAMQADYLRVCLIYADGGLYLDADIAPGDPLETLLAAAPYGLLTRAGPLINNAVLLFRAPRNPFLGACLTLMTDNILTRRFEDVLATGGPGLFSVFGCIVEPRWLRVVERLDRRGAWPFSKYWPELLHAARHVASVTPKLIESSSRITMMSFKDHDRWCRGADLEYKKAGKHWSNHRGSIYR